MFAIELCEDNLKKIIKISDLTVDEAYALMNIFHNRKYMFITGYTDRRGALHPWSIVPKYLFKEAFEFDPEVIKTDWDLIVRKPAA